LSFPDKDGLPIEAISAVFAPNSTLPFLCSQKIAGRILSAFAHILAFSKISIKENPATNYYRPSHASNILYYTKGMTKTDGFCDVLKSFSNINFEHTLPTSRKPRLSKNPALAPSTI